MYRQFYRAHAPGSKLTSSLCLYIGLVSVAGYKQLKWLVMKLGSGCGAVGCVLHAYIYLWQPTTILKLFQKALLNKHEHVMRV